MTAIDLLNNVNEALLAHARAAARIGMGPQIVDTLGREIMKVSAVALVLSQIEATATINDYKDINALLAADVVVPSFAPKSSKA